MPDRIARKRRSRRCTLWLASAVTAFPLASLSSAGEPAEPHARPVPRRLPVVKAENNPPPVQTCSAELDALVDSWFADPGTESNPDAIPPSQWLRSTSSSAAAEVARRLIAQATREYEAGAWLSAETSAWEGVRWAAESVDLGCRERGEESSPRSLETLQAAREAIREARDFSGVYGPLDENAIRRMAISHQTDLLDDESTAGMTATDASDRYLDHARVLLAPIARQSVEAAQGLDLLAAVYLRRADARTLPSATALCLRRAALQGQPHNASLASRLGMHLAELGLLDEARWALEHSWAIHHDPATAKALVQVLHRCGQHDQAAQWSAIAEQQLHGGSRLSSNLLDSSDAAGNLTSQGRVPEIIELSAEEFAKISQPVMPFERHESPQRTSATIEATTASVSTSVAQRAVAPASAISPTTPSDSQQEDPPGMIRRFFGSFKRIW